MSKHIGTRQESSLHAALKTWYAQSGDQVESPVDGYVIDIVRGDLLIEIQTRNFSSIRPKLAALLENHPLRLVYPVAAVKWIVRLAPDEKTVLSRRRSPKHGRPEEAFVELPFIARLVAHPNFSLEIVMMQAEEVLCNTPGRRRASWRRNGWRLHDRRLIEVLDRRVLCAPTDYLAFLPSEFLQPSNSPGATLREMPDRYGEQITVAPEFTSSDLAKAMKRSRAFAQKMTYSLREMGVIHPTGKRGRAMVYTVANLTHPSSRI